MSDNTMNIVLLFGGILVVGLVTLLIVWIASTVNKATASFQTTVIDIAGLLDPIKGDVAPGSMDVRDGVVIAPDLPDTIRMELKFTNFDLTDNGNTFNTLTKIRIQFGGDYINLDSVTVNGIPLAVEGQLSTDLEVAGLELASPEDIVVQMTFAAIPHSASEIDSIVFATD